jgi:hypothetical protein
MIGLRITGHQDPSRWVLLAVLAACSVTEPSQSAPTLVRVHELGTEEGVFAYARISPDGSFLVYASEARFSTTQPPRSQLINVIDLRDGELLFSEPGIDGYWSTDGRRMIFLSFAEPVNRVSIWHRETGEVVRDVAPDSLGDYYSWGYRDGGDLILTIRGRYYPLAGDRGVLPAASVPPCEGMGTGQRPLLSKDGKRITTFVRGTVVVRNLDDCGDILDTGLPGAKADFSWDGRYIAFHAPKPEGTGYEILVVDCIERTVRTAVSLPGSSLFPSWTQDGRLLFHHYGDDSSGFLLASGVLNVPARPLPAPQTAAADRSWSDVFPETPAPAEEYALVLVWGPWGAHTAFALHELEAARASFDDGVRVLMATDPASREADVSRQLANAGDIVERIPLVPERLLASEAHNQNPTVLLFRDRRLIDRRLGAQSAGDLLEWVATLERQGA